MMAAARFPEEWSGILAGAPAMNITKRARRPPSLQLDACGGVSTDRSSLWRGRGRDGGMA